MNCQQCGYPWAPPPSAVALGAFSCPRCGQVHGSAGGWAAFKAWEETRMDAPQFVVVACPNFDRKDVPVAQRASVSVGVCRKCGGYVVALEGWSAAPSALGIAVGYICFGCLGIDRPEVDEDREVRLSMRELVKLIRDPDYVAADKELEQGRSDDERGSD